MKHKQTRLLAWMALLALLFCLMPHSVVQGEKKQNSKTFEFTDSAGRTVTLPKEIKKVAPSGPLAQTVLFTAVPEKLVGIARPFGKQAAALIAPDIAALPVFGQFYGKNADLNLEALLKAAPDVVIDVGEAKKSIAEDMDKLQQQIGIPCVFIEAHLDQFPETYEKLAELFGESKHLSELARRCSDILERAEKLREEIKEEDCISVYWAMGEKGTATNARASFHSEALNLLPLSNVADVEASSKGGGTEVSLEQILIWDPDVILADTPEIRDSIMNDKSWETLRAVKEKKVYVIPRLPYHFLADPPSVNRLLGVEWLGSLLWPESCEFEIDERVREFYELFYGIECDDEMLEDILEPKADTEEKKAA